MPSGMMFRFLFAAVVLCFSSIAATSYEDACPILDCGEKARCVQQTFSCNKTTEPCPSITYCAESFQEAYVGPPSCKKVLCSRKYTCVVKDRVVGQAVYKAAYCIRVPNSDRITKSRTKTIRQRIQLTDELPDEVQFCGSTICKQHESCALYAECSDAACRFQAYCVHRGLDLPVVTNASSGETSPENVSTSSNTIPQSPDSIKPAVRSLGLIQHAIQSPGSIQHAIQSPGSIQHAIQSPASIQHLFRSPGSIQPAIQLTDSVQPLVQSRDSFQPATQSPNLARPLYRSPYNYFNMREGDQPMPRFPRRRRDVRSYFGDKSAQIIPTGGRFRNVSDMRKKHDGILLDYLKAANKVHNTIVPEPKKIIWGREINHITKVDVQNQTNFRHTRPQLDRTVSAGNKLRSPFRLPLKIKKRNSLASISDHINDQTNNDYSIDDRSLDIRKISNIYYGRRQFQNQDKGISVLMNKYQPGNTKIELMKKTNISSLSRDMYQNSSSTAKRKQNAPKILDGELNKENDSNKSPNLRSTKNQGNNLTDDVHSKTNQYDLPREIYDAGSDILLDINAVRMILNHFKTYGLRDEDVALLEKLLMWRIRATPSIGKPQNVTVLPSRVEEGNTSHNNKNEPEQKTQIQTLEVSKSNNENSRLNSTENKIKGAISADDRRTNYKGTPSWELSKSNVQAHMIVQNKSTDGKHVIQELFENHDMLLEMPQVEHNIEKKKGVSSSKNHTEQNVASINEKIFRRNQNILFHLSRGRLHLSDLHHKYQLFNHSVTENGTYNKPNNKSQDNVYQQNNTILHSEFTEVSLHTYEAKVTPKQNGSDGGEVISEHGGKAGKLSTSDDLNKQSVKDGSSSGEYHSNRLSKPQLSQRSKKESTHSAAKSTQKSHQTIYLNLKNLFEEGKEETHGKNTSSVLVPSVSEERSTRKGIILQNLFENTSLPNHQGQTLKDHGLFLADKGSEGISMDGKSHINQKEQDKRNDTQLADTGTRRHVAEVWGKNESRSEHDLFEKPLQANSKFIAGVIQQRRREEDYKSEVISEKVPDPLPKSVLDIKQSDKDYFSSNETLKGAKTEERFAPENKPKEDQSPKTVYDREKSLHPQQGRDPQSGIKDIKNGSHIFPPRENRSNLAQNMPSSSEELSDTRREFEGNNTSPITSLHQIPEGSGSEVQQHQSAVQLEEIPRILSFYELSNGTIGGSTAPLYRSSRYQDETSKESTTSMYILKENAHTNWSQVSSTPSHGVTEDNNYFVPRTGLNKEDISLESLGKPDFDNSQLKTKPNPVPVWSQFTKHTGISSNGRAKNLENTEQATYKQHIMKHFPADSYNLPQYNSDNLQTTGVPSSITMISDDMNHRKFTILPTSTPQYSNIEETPRDKIKSATNLSSSTVLDRNNNSSPSPALNNITTETVKPKEISDGNESLHEDAQFPVRSPNNNISQSGSKSWILSQMLHLNDTKSNKTDTTADGKDTLKTGSDKGSDVGSVTLESKDFKQKCSNNTTGTPSEVVAEQKNSNWEETKMQTGVNETKAINDSSRSPASSIVYVTRRKQHPNSLEGQRSQILPFQLSGNDSTTEKSGELLVMNPANSLSDTKSKPPVVTWIDSSSDVIKNIDPKGALVQRIVIPLSNNDSAASNDHKKRRIRKRYRNNKKHYDHLRTHQVPPFEEARSFHNGGIPAQVYQNLRNEDLSQRPREVFNAHRNSEEQGNYGGRGLEFGHIPQYFLPTSEGIIPLFRNVTSGNTLYEPYNLRQPSRFVQPVSRQYQWTEYDRMPQIDTRKLNEPEPISQNMQWSYDNTQPGRIPLPLNPKQPTYAVGILPGTLMQQNNRPITEVRPPSPEVNRQMWSHLGSNLYGTDQKVSYYAQQNPAAPGDYGNYPSPSNSHFQDINRERGDNVMNSNMGLQISEPQNPYLETDYYSAKKFNTPVQPNVDNSMVNGGEQMPRQRYPEARQKYNFYPSYFSQQQLVNDKPGQVQYPSGDDNRKVLPFPTDNIQPNIQENPTNGNRNPTRNYPNRYEDLFPYIQKEREAALPIHTFPKRGNITRLARLVGNERMESVSINGIVSSKKAFVGEKVGITNNSSTSEAEQENSGKILRELQNSLNINNSSINNQNATDTALPELRKMKQDEWENNKIVLSPILHGKEHNISSTNQTLRGEKKRTLKDDKSMLRNTEHYDRNVTQQLLLILKEQLFPKSVSTQCRNGTSSDCRSNKTVDVNSTSTTTVNEEHSTSVVSSITQPHSSNNNENIGHKVKESEPRSSNIDTNENIGHKVKEPEPRSNNIDTNENIGHKVKESEPHSSNIDTNENIGHTVKEPEPRSSNIDTYENIGHKVKKTNSRSSNIGTNENIGHKVEEIELQHVNGSKTSDTTTLHPRMTETDMNPPRIDQQLKVERKTLHETLMPYASQKVSNSSSHAPLKDEHNTEIVEEPRTLTQMTVTTTSKYMHQNEGKAREGGRKEENNHFSVDKAKSPEIHSQIESRNITALLEKVKSWKNNIVRISNDRYVIKD